jgi:hypothetical protein
MFEKDNNELYTIASSVTVDGTVGTSNIISHIDSYLLKEAEKGNFKYTVLINSMAKRYMPVGTSIESLLTDIKTRLEAKHFDVTEGSYYNERTLLVEWDELWVDPETIPDEEPVSGGGGDNEPIEFTLVSQRTENFVVLSTFENDEVAVVEAVDPDGIGIIYRINEDSGLYYIENSTGTIKLTADGATYVNDAHDLPTFTVDALSTSGTMSDTAQEGSTITVTPATTVSA